MSTEKRTQPEWLKPQGTSKGVKVNNSMKVGELVELIPQEGNLLRWYTCGPTVYDDSHLGHARNYLTFDIIRRIVEDYFGYEIFYCMNITDIDDKIILRSRRNYFFGQYLSAHPTLTQEVQEKLVESWTVELADLAKKIAKNDADQKAGDKNLTELRAARSLLDEKHRKAQEALAAVKAAELGIPSEALLRTAQEPLAALLDKADGASLDAEFIKKLCDEHAKRYEKEFFEDMKRLGVKSPDVVVRVSEYVPQVIAMVERIIQNGYAYVSEGSVYFDSAKFHTTPGHVYGKLAPWSIGNLELLAEGEGALTAAGVRKSDKDFALWKASKAGEPSWDSPWGKGRPGWHIECSAMAGEILGQVLDVHCGGADLKFPHHDNELAQAEACFDCRQWVNYFLHSGHLDIDGLKMSKSLKNFITIKDTLSKYSARQLRMLFLLQAWDTKMNYQVKDTMLEVDAKLKAFTEFLNKVKVLNAQREENLGASEAWTARDTELHQALLAAQKAVHEALSTNFNTSLAINVLTDIVNKSNAYIAANASKKALLLSKIAAYVVRILNVFGLDFTLSGASAASSSAAVSDEVKENIARPLVNEIANFRKAVRAGAKEKKEPSYFLELCDKLRDEQMPQHGVKIVDDNEFSFFFVDKDELLAEIAKKKAEAAEGAKQKQKRSVETKLAQLKKDLERWEKNSLTPAEVVKAKYNVEITNPEELPATDLAGKELSGGAKKQIPKLWSQQTDARAKYEAELAKDAKFLDNMRSQIADLEKQLASFQ